MTHAVTPPPTPTPCRHDATAHTCETHHATQYPRQRRHHHVRVLAIAATHVRPIIAAVVSCSIYLVQLRCSSLHSSQVFNLSFPSKPNKMFVNLII